MTNPSYDHLGGHLDMTHVDDGALRWLKSIGVMTLLDIGCSVGGQIRAALEAGIGAWGIEGDYSLLQQQKTLAASRILFSDLTKTWIKLPVAFDAIWCVEVAEHIEERYLPNLMLTIINNLKPNGTLVFTANEGEGIHHVTRKPVEWWKKLLLTYFLKFDPDQTKQLIAASTMEREFIRNTGMVFSRQ